MRKFLKNKKKKSVMFLDYEKNRKKIPAFRCKRPWHKICLIMKRGNDIPEFPSGRRRAPDGKRGGNDHEMSLAGRGPSRSCRMQPAHSRGSRQGGFASMRNRHADVRVPCLGRLLVPRRQRTPAEGFAGDSVRNSVSRHFRPVSPSLPKRSMPRRQRGQRGGNPQLPHCPPSVGFSAA